MLQRLSSVLAVLLLSHACSFAQDKPKSAYPDTADGLKKLMEDTLAASKAGEKDKTAGLVKGLILPNHEAWFKKAFGDEKGAKLAAEYGERLSKFEEELTAMFAEMVKKNQTNVHVFRIEKADDPNATGLQKDALTTMKQPAALYTVKLIAPGKDAGMSLWSFIYADGGFRLVGKMRTVK